MSDIETDSDEDEVQLNDLKQLTAVLEADEATTIDTVTQAATSVASTSNSHISTLNPKTSSTGDVHKINSALALNRLYDEKLRRLERVLSVRLVECRNKIKEIQTQGPIGEKREVFRYINCGKPYFRDRSNFSAPDNEDTIMVKSQMYDFSQITSVPGWTVKDKSQFISMIHKMSQDIRKAELYSKIAALRRLNKKSTKLEIAAVEREIDRVKEQPLSELALPLDREYDWETLANKLSRRHTAQEYQSLWKLFFHPCINKNSWNKTEHATLRRLATQYQQQDWDAIAAELNTGRTGYQCFVYYKTNMFNISNGQKWSNEEVTYLKRLIEYFSQDNYIPWGKIAAAMENRNKIQIYNKYLRIIEQRKGRFLPEEDSVILNCVHRFGKDFRKMTNYLPGRSVSQLRTRYNVINTMRVSTVWSIEDDRKLIQIMSNQDSDAAYSSATKHFPGRTRMNIRSRHVTLRRWMKRHPNIDIHYAPRRGARRLNCGQPSEDLNKAIEELKNTLKVEAEIKSTKKKITSNSNESEIEDAIVATLINEHLKEENRKNMLRAIGDEISEDPSTPASSMNLTNLNKCLVFLESALNRQKFNTSDYRKLYPQLGQTEPEVCLVRVKSYSKKETVKTIKVHGAPDVWGHIALSRRKYVLPPHYATITGCRAIMAHVASMASGLPNINVMIKRNSILKQEYNHLLQRFDILFLWPMLLSNEGPLKRKSFQRANKLGRAPIPTTEKASSLSTVVRLSKRFRTYQHTPNIDLEEEDDKDKITLRENLSEITEEKFGDYLNNIV